MQCAWQVAEEFFVCRSCDDNVMETAATYCSTCIEEMMADN
jgi:hypothetical protein